MLRRAKLNGDPVFAPDGQEIAFLRIRIVSGHFERKFKPRQRKGVDLKFGIWTVNVASGTLQKVTPWRRKALIPSSFSSDGSRLAVTAIDKRGHLRVRALDLSNRSLTTIARSGSEPVYSPVGSRVAFLRDRVRQVKTRKGVVTNVYSDIYVVGSQGGPAVRLTRDHRQKTSLSWDPSGKRISFTRSPRKRGVTQLPGKGASIMQINADGTCLRRILPASQQLLFGAAWQPGPGREAGRIAC